MDSRRSSDNLWPVEKSVQLAQLLEANPCLWDRNDAGYKKKIKRFASVKSIAEALDMPHAIVDVKIRSIIGQFQREVKKEGTIKTGVHAEKRYKSKWFLYNHLQFLLSVTSIRSTIDSSASTDDIMLQMQEEGALGHDYNDKSLSDTIVELSTDCSPPFDLAIEDDAEHVSANEKQLKRQSDEFDQRFTHRDKKIKTETEAIVTALHSISKSLADDKHEQDEYDIFGSLVAKKIRSLKSPMSRLQAENEINNILLKRQAEENGGTLITSEMPFAILKKNALRNWEKYTRIQIN